MAFVTAAPQSTGKVDPSPSSHVPDITALLSMVLFSVYAAKKSKREMRRLQRKLLWTVTKLKLGSMFSFKRAISDRQLLIYILLAVIFLTLLVVYPLLALLAALIILVLILTGSI
jgi:membrane-associated HD superfamily phosphohydrolase